MSFLNSINQTPNPLNTTFFCGQNIDRIQRSIRQKVRDSTGYSIDNQNADDLITIMRTVYLNNFMNGYSNVQQQVALMNQRVVETCVPQIYTGLSQYIGYVKDISSNPVPLDLPKNESIYGEFLDVNTRIGT